MQGGIIMRNKTLWEKLFQSLDPNTNISIMTHSVCATINDATCCVECDNGLNVIKCTPEGHAIKQMKLTVDGKIIKELNNRVFKQTKETIKRFVTSPD